MRKRTFGAAFFGAVSIGCVILFSACASSVVPCAWVRLDMDGSVVYTSDTYAVVGAHVYFYENEDEMTADENRTNYDLSITFYPRILGKDTVGGEKTTTVDISSDCSMTVYINKTKEFYSENKKIYLNGSEITPKKRDDFDALLCLYFEDVAFIRGNPNGKLNGEVNVIQYR